jgi:hypothetical protein
MRTLAIGALGNDHSTVAALSDRLPRGRRKLRPMASVRDRRLALHWQSGAFGRKTIRGMDRCGRFFAPPRPDASGPQTEPRCPDLRGGFVVCSRGSARVVDSLGRTAVESRTAGGCLTILCQPSPGSGPAGLRFPCPVRNHSGIPGPTSARAYHVFSLFPASSLGRSSRTLRQLPPPTRKNRQRGLFRSSFRLKRTGDRQSPSGRLHAA